ncbi:hypothetical protein ABW21_db0208457 [Orbilia brochopaga]|nr:hypothetical protein ABW21_db0208457 [Drechslerella brochopaga]
MSSTVDPFLVKSIRERLNKMSIAPTSSAIAASVASNSIATYLQTNRPLKASERYRLRKARKVIEKVKRKALNSDSETSSDSDASSELATTSDDDDDSTEDDTSSTMSTNTYKSKLFELYEIFKDLPPNLRKIEIERYLTDPGWKENKDLRGVKESTSSLAIHFHMLGIPRAFGNDKSERKVSKATLMKTNTQRKTRRVPVLPPAGPIWEDSHVDIGSKKYARIDLRNPIIIDPYAAYFPQQEPKFLSIAELGLTYQFYLELETAREAKKRGRATIREDFKARIKLEKQKLTEMIEGQEEIGPTDEIPFNDKAIICHPRQLIPLPSATFLDLVKVRAPKILPISDVKRPFDWIPRGVGKLDECKTLPAIFWSVSDKDHSAVVFIIFETTAAINDPVSIGIVDGEQGVANIRIDSCCYMSDMRKKLNWSGYIDFSRPMIVRFEDMYCTNEDGARANEQQFWDVWKCLFKKPTYGGHQYGMTSATLPYENPYRLMQLFESKQNCHGKYTKQKALKRPAARMREVPVSVDDDDCATVIGQVDTINLSDDDRTITGRSNDGMEDDELNDGIADDNVSDAGSVVTAIWLGEPDDKPGARQPEVEIADDDDAVSVVTAIWLGDEADRPGAPQTNIERTVNIVETPAPVVKPSIETWLNSVFDRPPAISLGEDIHITKPDLAPKPRDTLTYPRTYKPLTEVTVKELGRPAPPVYKVHDDPSEYPETQENIWPQGQVNNLTQFQRRLLEQMNEAIGLDGKPRTFSSFHTGYMYTFPEFKNTKEFLHCYVKECVERARKAEIAETGKSENIDSVKWPWLEMFESKKDEMVDVQKVLTLWNTIYRPGEKITRDQQECCKQLNQALKEGKFTYPFKWLPKEVQMTIKLHEYAMVKREKQPWQSKDEVAKELPPIERWQKAARDKGIRDAHLAALEAAKAGRTDDEETKEGSQPSSFGSSSHKASDKIASEKPKKHKVSAESVDFASSVASKVPLPESESESGSESEPESESESEISQLSSTEDSDQSPIEASEPARQSPENLALASTENKSSIANSWMKNLANLKKKKKVTDADLDRSAQDDRGSKHKLKKLELQLSQALAVAEAERVAKESAGSEKTRKDSASSSSSAASMCSLSSSLYAPAVGKPVKNGASSSASSSRGSSGPSRQVPAPETSIRTNSSSSIKPNKNVSSSSASSTASGGSSRSSRNVSAAGKKKASPHSQPDKAQKHTREEVNKEENTQMDLATTAKDVKENIENTEQHRQETDNSPKRDSIVIKFSKSPKNSQKSAGQLEQGNILAYLQSPTTSACKTPSPTSSNKTSPQSRIPIRSKSVSPLSPRKCSPPSIVRLPRNSASRIPLPISRNTSPTSIRARSHTSSLRTSPNTSLVKSARQILESKATTGPGDSNDRKERLAKIQPVQIPTVFNAQSSTLISPPPPGKVKVTHVTVAPHITINIIQSPKVKDVDQH